MMENLSILFGSIVNRFMVRNLGLIKSCLSVRAVLLLLFIASVPYSALAAQAQNPVLTTEHEITLTPLLPDTKYYYSVLPAGALFTRGPYLQLATSTSMTVKWRSNVATSSTVDYRLTPFAGSSSFVTSPVPGSAKPTRIWVIGDGGKNNTDARAVRDAYLGFTGLRGTDVWLTLGDNAYSFGTDLNYQTKFFDMHPAMLSQVAAWSTFGNHDAMSADSATQTGPYFDAFKFPVAAEAGGLASGTEAYYSFEYGNIHFVSLDTQLSSSTLPLSTMLTWLVSDLAANLADWTIVIFHHPPYSKGSHDSDTETRLVQARENVVPILEANGVDLVLSGHSHSYERSKFIDGHYGPSISLLPSMIINGGNGQGVNAYTKDVTAGKANKGTVYVTAGNSGWIRTGPLAGPLNHPAMSFSLLSLGSIVIDISGNTLDANFIDQTGIVKDSFTIKHVQPADTVAPVVIAPVDIINFEATGLTTVVPLGTATANDNIDGVLTPTASFTGPFTVGVHTITWSAIDAAGNTGLATQTVTVQDTTPPVISLIGGNITIAIGTAYFDEGATAVDLVDGVLSTIASGVVNTALAGNYTVTYNVTDSAGNAATPVTRKVTVVAGTAPVVIAPADITTEATAPLTAVALGTATTDIGPIPTTNTPGPFAVGVHQVIWQTTNVGVTGSAVQTVTIVDTTVPVITLIGGNVTMIGGVDSTYGDDGAIATDAVDGIASLTAVGTVNVDVPGSYTLIYGYTDSSGNVASTVTRRVNVAAAGTSNGGSTVQVPLTGTAASVNIVSNGQAITDFSATVVTGAPPPGISFPFGVVSYSTTSAVGGSQMVNLSFSTALPGNLVLYKVNNAGVYTLIPKGAGVDQWDQLNATTVAITLTDGGLFDLDGSAFNGVIVDPVAVGSAPPVAANASGGGGGCTLQTDGSNMDPLLPLLALLSIFSLWNRRRV